MSEEKQKFDLVPVHGGLPEPVDRTTRLVDRSHLLREAVTMPQVRILPADLSTLYRFADGGLSPLEGPMTEGGWHRSLDDGTVESRGEEYAWTIPMSFPITGREAKALTPGSVAALCNEHGEVVGILEDIDVFEWDKRKFVESVYATDRLDHPGGRIVERDERSTLVGGRLKALPQPVNSDFGRYQLSPISTRLLIKERKWERALAFQTRNPLHRAHEYALVAGAERLTKSGFFTGVVLNPLVGQLKGDDLPAETRMRCYRVLKERQLLGEGDCDPEIWDRAGYQINEVFELIALDIKMYYGGPKEAVMHGIYRQNYGFTDLVIGRKHADAPFEDGTPIWGDFDAQEVFDKIPGKLAIEPCKIGFAAFYESLGRVDLTENHPDEKPVAVSGSEVRRLLGEGVRPDPRILRAEVADILIETYKAS